MDPWIDHDEGVRVIPRLDGSFDYIPLQQETPMTRPIYVIASEIKADMTAAARANKQQPCRASSKFAYAWPYLEALEGVVTITDRYYEDTAESVVAYFLGNATTWRGDVAKRIKAELNAMLKAQQKARV